MKIRFKFLLIFLLVSILPLIVLAIYNYETSRAIVTQDAQDNLEAVAAGKASIVNSVLAGHYALVDQIATGSSVIADLDTYNQTGVLLPATIEGVRARVAAVFLRSQRNPSLADIQSIAVADNKGVIVASSAARGKPTHCL